MIQPNLGKRKVCWDCLRHGLLASAELLGTIYRLMSRLLGPLSVGSQHLRHRRPC